MWARVSGTGPPLRWDSANWARNDVLQLVVKLHPVVHQFEDGVEEVARLAVPLPLGRRVEAPHFVDLGLELVQQGVYLGL